MRWGIYLGVLAYAVLAIGTIKMNWTRAAEGLARGARFLSGFLPPDFTSKGQDILDGLAESLTMTVVATALGITRSIPVALGAARNPAPLPIYLFCRGIIAVKLTRFRGHPEA